MIGNIDISDYITHNTLKDHIDTFYDQIDNSPSGPNTAELIALQNKYSKIDDLKFSKTPGQQQYLTLHLNIHSLPDKHSQLQDMIAQLKDKGTTVHFILLCETFLKESNAMMYPIPGYNFMHRSRLIKKQGGVAMYILDEFSYEECPELCTFYEGEFECIFVKVRTGTNKKIVLGEIYRVPNTNERLALSRYEAILDQLHNNDTDVIIGTDQNFDFLQINSHRNTADLLDSFLEVGLFPTINKPTRVTHCSKTLIDNLYVKCGNKSDLSSGIILSDISDHFPIFFYMKHTGTNITKSPLRFSYRPINETSLVNIKHSLSLIDWSYLHNLSLDHAYEEFIKTLNNIINDHAPMQDINIPYTKNYQATLDDSGSNTIYKVQR